MNWKAITLAFSRGSLTMAAFPKSLLSIATMLGGLAIFFILASLLMVSRPIGSTVRGYFDILDHSTQLDRVSWSNLSVSDSHGDGNVGNSTELGLPVPEGKGTVTISQHGSADANNSRKLDLFDDSKNLDLSPGLTEESSVSSNVTEGIEDAKHGLGSPNKTASNLVEINVTTGVSSHPKTDGAATLAPKPGNISWSGLKDSGCDIYHGAWIYDPSGPLYTNNTCPILTQTQNCQGNGRPDKEYENWRWKPAQCDLPRFDGKKFLELMRGKTIAFVGDSVARNQMESLMCILWQVEVPKNRGNRKMQRYYFRSTSTMIIRIWSSWLVNETSGSFDFAPEGVVKLHLDVPDGGFMERILDFDVLVLSSGHWFAKQSIYLLNNEIVGGHMWWPNKSHSKKINNIEAFGISVESVLTSIVNNPNYTGLTIVRSYSPDHYEGGAWNTGGSCTGKARPLLDGELVENGFTNIMHEKQVRGFNRAVKKITNKSKLSLMDITEVFGYRHDGHPGPYRSPDPNKITKRGPDGRPPPQDCLHWCMPGPVDTWNEMMLEIIRREFEG